MNAHVSAINVDHQSPEFFQSLVETAGVAMFVYQQERFVYANAMALQLIGYTSDELLSMTCLELLHADDKGAEKGRMQARLRGEDVANPVEFRVLKKNGSIIWVNYHAACISYQGRPAIAGVVRTSKHFKSTEVMYTSLFENNFVANILLQDHRFFDCNAATLRMFGYADKSEFCHLHPGQVSPPYQPNGVDSMMAANQCITIALDQGFHQFEWLHQTKQGEIFTAEVLLRPIIADGQQLIHAMVVDISERKRSEANLKYRFAIEKSLATASKALISASHPNINQALQVLAEVIDVDRAYVFQLRTDTPQSMDNTHEWCAPGVKPAIDDLQGLGVALFPWWISHMRQGKSIIIADVADLPAEAEAEKDILQGQGIKSLLAVPLLNPDGDLIGFIGFDDVRTARQWEAEDIGVLKTVAGIICAVFQRSQLLDSLQTSQADLLKAQSMAHIGSWKSDPHCMDSDSYSAETNRIFGVPPDYNVNHRSFLKLVHRDDRAKVLQAMRSAYTGVPFAGLRYRIVRPDGEVRHVQANGEANARKTRHEKNHSVFGTVQDITDQVALEMMQQKIDAAQSESKAKSDFLAVMSHELRTPLHGIIGLQDLLAQELKDIPDLPREHLQLAQHSAHILSSLIDDILDLSKIESGTMALQQHEFDLQQLLHNALLTFLAGIQQKGIELELHLETVPKQVFADETKLRQILLNIVGNAVKFTTQGSVRLHAQYSNGCLFLEVKDTGIGIEPENLTNLFQPFKQLSLDAARQGTGLGTTIAMKFAKMMHGDIHVQSELGRGSSFHITLPMEARSDENISQCMDINEHTLAATAQSDEQVSLKGMRLLLAEDDPIARFIATEHLQHTGLHIDVAENGLIAWEKLQKDDFDVLLTDIRMPGVDGLELTRKVRQLEQQHHARPMIIIGLSAHAMAHVETEAYAAGMNGFIAKPIVPDALMQRLLHIFNIRV